MTRNEAERVVLSAMLRLGAQLMDTTELIRDRHFQDAEHAAIFSAIVADLAAHCIASVSRIADVMRDSRALLFELWRAPRSATDTIEAVEVLLRAAEWWAPGRSLSRPWEAFRVRLKHLEDLEIAYVAP